ncbi:hypothetical protein OG806_42185 [Streptomyces sp. NBC_00882]|uniref:hypothetical protein n=1 Tax=Streptomyces sp. NBC_00882 TaxID=2975856 RepID=UPI003865AE90|nr:hypothetical protein OG806_42185 [Streptomyces sp. NBC_00882]
MLDARRRNVVFVTIMLGMLLAGLDQTLVGTALPRTPGRARGGPGRRHGVEQLAGGRGQQDIGRSSGTDLRAAVDTTAKTSAGSCTS